MDLGVKFPTPIADAQLHAAFGQASEQAFPTHNLPSGRQISKLVILKVEWLLKMIEFLLEIRKEISFNIYRITSWEGTSSGRILLQAIAAWAY